MSVEAFALIQQSPLLLRIGWTLVHTLWLGCAAGLLLGAALLAIPRHHARARYAALCIALGAITLTPAVLFPLVHPSPEQSTVSATAAESTTIAAPATTAALATSQAQDVDQAMYPAYQRIALAQAAQASPWQRWINRATRGASAVLPWAVLVWLAGATLLSIRELGGYVACHRLRRVQVSPAPATLSEEVARLVTMLAVRVPVRVLESMRVKVPCVVGWLRPVLLMPVGLASGLSVQQIESIIVHELAHIRRYDFLVNLLQAVAESLLFFHPLVWVISRRIRLEREHCCDEAVIAWGANPDEYAHSLLELVRLSRSGTPLVVSAADGWRSVRARVARLMGDARPPEHGRWPLAMVVMAAVIGAVVLSARAEHADRSVLAVLGRLSPQQAVVIDPGPLWQDTTWGFGLSSASQLSWGTGWTRAVVSAAQCLRIWYAHLSLPVDVSAYPIAVLTYRASNLHPDDRYVIWMADHPGRSDRGIEPFRHQDLILDGRIHQLRRDLRELSPSGPILAVAMGVQSGAVLPAELELLQLHFERAPGQGPNQTVTDGQPIQIQVVNGEGTPVQGASATVDAERPNWRRSAITGPDGKASVTPLRNGDRDDHVLSVARAGHVPVRLLVSGKVPSSPRITLPRDFAKTE